MKTSKRILTVKESIVKNINEGDQVKLGKLFKEDLALVITKTETTLTVLVDGGCYDFQIEKGK
jgi:hypothetical protein